MKTLIIHNDYGKFSGEESVVRNQVELLCSMGHEVVEYRRSSTELYGISGSVKGFVCGMGNPFAKRKIQQVLEQEKPDIVHIHNLYPLISPAILPVIKGHNIPIVMTVHNFRLVCPNGLFSVNNHICEECARKKSVMPCLQNNCLGYKMKTTGYALRSLIAQRKRWYLDNVDRFLCLTEFQRDKLVSYGLPEGKCTIVPNFIEQTWLDKSNEIPPNGGDYVGYLGRLSEEKGIDILLEAAQQLPEISFRIAGNGREAYEQNAPSNVEFVGYLSGNAKIEFMRNAKINLMASRCYENFPTTLLQAMSLGVPSVVPQLGGMPEIIKGAGESFVCGNTAKESGKYLADTLQRLWNTPEQLAKYRAGAKIRIRDFTSNVVGRALLNVYKKVITERISAF